MSMRRDVKRANAALLAVNVTELVVTRVWRDSEQITLWLSATHRADKRAVDQQADRLVGTVFGYNKVWDVRREGHGFVVTGGMVDKAELSQQLADERAQRQLIGQPPLAHRIARVDVDGALSERGLGDWHMLPERLQERAPQIMQVDTAVEFWAHAGLGRAEQTPEGIVVHSPTLLAVKRERDGISIALRGLPGQGLPQWQKQLPQLRSQFNAPAMTVRQLSGDTFELSWHDLDAFSTIDFRRSVPTPYDAERGRSELGMTALGEPAIIPWANQSGCVIGGVPGSGKTASLLPVFAGLVGHAELRVHDGKAGHDLTALEPICRVYDRSAQLDAVLTDAQSVLDIARQRVDVLLPLTGESNFWNIPTQRREELGLYPIFLVLDECQSYLDDGGMEKDEKAVIVQIRKAIRDLIKLYRAAGVVVVLTTQKPTSDSIPTPIRDNAGLRVCFRVATVQAAASVLPAIGEGDPSPTTITTDQRGRCVVEVEGYGLSMAQTWYVPASDVAAALRDAQPVPDQAEGIAALVAQHRGAPEPEPAPRPERIEQPAPVAPEPEQAEEGSEPAPPAPAPFIPPTTGTTPAQTPNLFG